MIEQFFDLDARLLKLDEETLALCRERFAEIDKVKEYNQLKMLKAFTSCAVAANHLTGSTGYGYDDAGREKLSEVFAALTGSEDALVRSGFMSGTHTLTVLLFGLLRAGDSMLCVTGKPYDTLCGVIGLDGTAQNGKGSLAEYGVSYTQVELLADGSPDLRAIAAAAAGKKICYIQRSRGYAGRPALSLDQIEAISRAAKGANPAIWVAVDNCYGEFTQKEEPTQRGADIMAGSLIKNPGGGIAPTGGYIAGKKELVELCAHRLTAPGTGREIGCTLDTLRELYLGLYFAPGVTAEALKTAVYAACLFEKLGFETKPRYYESRNDIVTSIETKDPGALCAICRGIQAGSPIDSFVTPEPWPMPGYDSDVVMAAGAFTLGSSIELSCDAPMKAPYTAYMQGGLNFTAGRAGVLLAAQRVLQTRKEEA